VPVLSNTIEQNTGSLWNFGRHVINAQFHYGLPIECPLFCSVYFDFCGKIINCDSIHIDDT